MKLNTLSLSLRIALAGMAIVGTATPSFALGLGQVQIRSSIGQALIADVELLAEPSEIASLRMSIAPAAEYKMQGIEFNPALNGAHITVKKNEAGKTISQIVTKSVIQSPYVQVIVDGETAAGKVRRTYSIFIDPSRQAITKLPGEASASEMGRTMVELPDIKGLSAIKNSFPSIVQSVASPTPVREKAASSGDVVLTNIMQNGTAPPYIDVIKGYGRKQPIKHALFTIVPKGWKGYAIDAGVKFSGTTDWEGNRDWLSALDGVLSASNVMATVDWTKKEITFASMGAVESSGLVARTPSMHQAMVASNDNPLGDQQLAEIAKNRAELASITIELQQSKENLAQMRQEAQASKAIAESMEKDGKSKNLSNQKDLKIAKAEQEKLKAELDSEAEKNRLTIDSNSQEKRYAQVYQELESSKAQFAEAELRVNAITTDAVRYKKQAEGLVAALNRSESLVTNLTQEVSEANSRNNQENRDFQILDEKTKSLRKLLDDANEQISIFKESQSAFKAKLVDAQSGNNQTQSIVDDLKLQIVRMQKDLESLTARDAAQVKQISDLQMALKGSQEDLMKSDSAVQTQRTQINHMSTTLAATQERLSTYMSGSVPKKADAIVIPTAKSLSISGPAMLEQSTVPSSGMNVAFTNAIRQIIPGGWMITSDTAITNAPVSWNGRGRAWTQVFDEMLSSQKLKATIDTVGREVTIRR